MKRIPEPEIEVLVIRNANSGLGMLLIAIGEKFAYLGNDTYMVPSLDTPDAFIALCEREGMREADIDAMAVSAERIREWNMVMLPKF